MDAEHDSTHSRPFHTHPHTRPNQDEASPIEASLAAFQRQFARQDQFRLGCGLCILLQDQLLTRAQVRTGQCNTRAWVRCGRTVGDVL